MHVNDQVAHSGGTDHYHRFSALFRNVLLTDGVQRLATENSAFWLLDVIGSHLPKIDKNEDPFLVARLTKTGDHAARFTFDGGGKNDTRGAVLVTQVIDYTDYDFPAYGSDEVKLYVVLSGDPDGSLFWVVMLPEEY